MKFITLSSHRSGSSLLQRMLDSHPDIRARQEDMRDHNRVGKEGMRKRIDDIFATEAKVKNIGFKVQYTNVRSWFLDYLEKRPEIKKIHLIRREMLETVFWYPGNYKGKVEGGFGPPLTVPEGNEIRANIDKVVNTLKWIRGQIKMYEKMSDFTIYHEDDLTGGTDATEFYNEETRKKLLTKFFKVKDRKLVDAQKGQRKAKRKPLAELVVNYKELMAEIKKKKVVTYYE